MSFTKNYLLAQRAVGTGWGSVDGKTAMGIRTEYEAPHGTAYSIGLKTVWGAIAIPGVDNITRNYALMVTAYTLPGEPAVI